MRAKEYFLTEEFLLKLQSVCRQRPTAAYYDTKSNRLVINDLELFAQSVKQIDNRSLPTFMKRLRVIGYVEIETENTKVFEWSRKSHFELQKQILKANEMVSTSLQKRRLVMQNVNKRKQYVNQKLQKLIFQLLILEREETPEWAQDIESMIGEVESIIKATTMESIEAIDEIEKIGEQEIFIYKNLLSSEGQRF